jgi:quinol monooxygenase YgiN
LVKDQDDETDQMQGSLKNFMASMVAEEEGFLRFKAMTEEDL